MHKFTFKADLGVIFDSIIVQDDIFDDIIECMLN